VVNVPLIKPMDTETIINLATHTGRVVTIEENTTIGGFGSGVMEVLSEKGINIPVKCVGLPDRFLAHGTQGMLREQLGLNKQGIKKTVKFWLDRE